ncbi:MAG: tetratricopeptide repeat protein [Elusimicrobia bacterium]|nr:tetratricopeptide repeat protein [Elusimicrobiota bacterium]
MTPARLLLALVLLAPGSALAAGKSAYQHYLKALLHTNQAQYAEAMKEYEAALALDPLSSTMLRQATRLALEMNDAAKALDYASKTCELAPEDPEAFFLLGQVRWARGEGPESRAAFEKALALRPGYSEALFALGNLLGALAPEDAKPYLERYVKENPDDSSEALFQIALLESRAGRDSEAESRLKEAITADADNMPARHALAELYELRRDTDAALAAYSGIIERDPRNVVLLDHVGEIYVLKDDAAKAKEHFLRAKEIAPSHPATCLWLALMAEEAGDYAEAAKQVSESAALSEDAALSLRLSYYLTQAGRLKDAVTVLEKAHARWPANEEVAYFFGLGLDDLKSTAKAAAMMEKVLKLRPGHRDALFQLGAMREKRGELKAAEAAFRTLLKGHPNDAAALNYLGYSLADRGTRLEEALALVERAAALDPESGAYMDSVGWTLFKLGKIDEAVARLKLAVAALPGDETVSGHLADAQEAAGDAAGAWESVKRAQAAAPDNAALAKRAERLEEAVDPGELGARTLALQKALRGKLGSYGGPCVVEGTLGGRTFKFNAFVHYRAGRALGLEVLGPLFVPLFRADLGIDESFTMDPFAIEGVSPEAARDAVYAALRLMRTWFDGSAFDGRPAVFKRSWRKPARVETASAVVTLDKAGALVDTVGTASGGLELALSDYRPLGGRTVPSVLRVQTRGFALEFRFSRPEVRFE